MAPLVCLSPHRSLLLPTGEGVHLVLFIITPAFLIFLLEISFLLTTPVQTPEFVIPVLYQHHLLKRYSGRCFKNSQVPDDQT